MPLPRPVSGLVIRYSYLWRQEFLRGQEEGQKDRPCAIILASSSGEGTETVTVLPITHTPPSKAEEAIEIPLATKQRLGLDAERSWIVLMEANRFVWPGPDLRPAAQNQIDSIAYGLLPKALFEQMRQSFVALLKSRRAAVVSRSP